MTALTFHARGDRSTSSSSINAINTNQVPVTTMTFVRNGPGGDVRLEPNGGQPDPDTLVVINSQSYSFVVNFSGQLASVNKLSNVNGVDLRGKPVAIVTVAGQRYVFLTDGSGTPAVMSAFPSGTIAVVNPNSTDPILICFVSGTLIATPSGERPVEAIRPGDLVLTADGAAQPVVWIGRRTLSAADLLLNPRLRPVIVPAGLFGPGLPRRDLGLSPQHRIVIRGGAVDLLAGCGGRALAPAIHFVGHGARRAPVTGPVTYHHLLFERHEIVLSEGLPTESLQPGALTLAGFEDARTELLALFPELAHLSRGRLRRDALPSLRAHEVAALMRHLPA
ncbi:Hint domain-containing protein [Rubellimicrobium sp. CFH 75288]|uniref:Hint domain-containing protein n=1 Tax=Rubellimicrobium sp. CFH 75288 TaxID=2697034 RepID=UPI00141203D5|nr:Hint domain-containing protein [Rubellimicrobium sp. CFH 75288]NAZ35236.1 hypothetical protein [Rubellimicrobium sp. CFH 75288]